MTRHFRLVALEVTAIALTLILIALLAHRCLAAEAAECTSFHAVTAGAPAPCDGVLMPTSEAARIPALEDALALAQAELSAERARRHLDGEEAAQLLQVCEASRLACERDRAPAPPAAPHWYESGWFHGAVGAVLGVGVTIGIVYAVR